MLAQINARTLRAHQVKQRLTNRGFDCIRVVGGSNCMPINRYLSRHPEATFIPTVSENIIVMISSNKLTYVLEAVRSEVND